jgi:molybdopterin molybdotransferase
MGKYDLVEPVFKELGVTVHFDSVNMRPGKPTVFATRKGRCVFGLPGNPVSAFVAFELFVTPVLRALQGLPAETLSLIRGVLSSAVREKSGRTAFLPARVEFQRGMVEIAPVNWKGSADIFSPVNANALLIVPSEVSNFQTGDEADALLFDEVEHVMETCF